MRIALYIHSVSNGGAEKVAARLSQIWSGLGHEIVLLTQNPQGDKEYLHQCVAREHVPYGSVTSDTAENIRGKYGLDLLVFNDSIGDENFLRVFSAFRSLDGLKIAVIIHHTANNWMYTTGCTQELTMDGLLRQADAMVCVDKMWALWWYHRGCRSLYIQNPASVSFPLTNSDGGTVVPFSLVWVGRIMDWAKQPEKMVSAFAAISRQVPEARLVMLGAKTRAAEAALLKRVPKDVRSKIDMPGFVVDADAYMRKAALHVFTSLTEVTVPQVVMEAQCMGLPTVALDMPVLRGMPGISLAEDECAFVSLVVRYLAANKGGRALIERTLGADGSVEAIGMKWDELFSALAAGGIDALARRRRKEWQSEVGYDMLLEELHRSQAYFVQKYLPEYLKWRRWKTRADVSYLASRLVAKIGMGG